MRGSVNLCTRKGEAKCLKLRPPTHFKAALMRVTYVIHFETITFNNTLSDTHTISRGAFVKYHVVGRVRWILEYQIVEHGSF